MKTGRPPMRPFAMGVGLLCWAFGIPAAEQDMDLANAIFVRVNGQPVMYSDVQDTAVLIVRTQMDGRPPTGEADKLKLQSEAVRRQVRAYLILEDMRKHKIKTNKDELNKRFERLKIPPTRVPPGIRRLVEAESVFAEVLMRAGIPRVPPAPDVVRAFYQRHASRMFREPGRFKFRRALFYEGRGETRADVVRRVEDELAKLRATPEHARAAAVDQFIRAKSKDVFAADGGLMLIDPDMGGPGWSHESFGYQHPETGERPMPEPVVEAMLALVRAGRSGEFTTPIQTDLGLMVVYVEEAAPGKVVPFNEAKEFIEFVVGEESNDRRSRNWLKRKHEQSRIEWHNKEPYTLEELLPPTSRAE